MGLNHDQLVDAQFGQQAGHYVASAVHASGEDLIRIGEVARLGGFASALDLGCGGGHVTYAIAPHITHVIASDLSGGMLDAVAREANRRALANVETRLAPAERLPFDDASFHLVVSRYSAHHWRDWNAGLREAGRVVRSGGTVLFSDVIAPAAPVLDTHLQAIELLRDPSHVRDYTLAEWMTALADAGLVPTAFKVHRLPLDFSSWIERMATPDVAQRAIRWLQDGASTQVREAFEVASDGSFVVDSVLIEAIRKAD